MGKTLLVFVMALMLSATVALADEKTDKKPVETNDETSTKKAAREFEKESPNPPHRSNYEAANEFFDQQQFRRDFFMRGNERNMRKPLEDTFRLDRRFELKERFRVGPGLRR